jgi:hypothetical protein
VVFPQVATEAGDNSGGVNGTSHTVSLPASIASGDLLVDHRLDQQFGAGRLAGIPHHRLARHHPSRGFGGVQSSSSANPNPPSLDPSGWDVEDTLAICGYDDGRRTVTAYPTNYTNGRTTGRQLGRGGDRHRPMRTVPFVLGRRGLQAKAGA